jgi:hypothetical protein
MDRVRTWGLLLAALIAGNLYAQQYSVSPIPAPAGWSTSLNGCFDGINGSGQVAGSAYEGATWRAFTGTAAGSTLIPLPAGWQSSAGYGINDSGQVAGSVSNETGGAQAFIGTAAGSTPIPLPAGWSRAYGYGINNSGQVAGQVSNEPAGAQAFIGTAAGSTLIPLPAGWQSSAGYGINDSGQVAGSVSNETGGAQAFIGTAAGSTPIPLPAGWSRAYGYGINNSGQVAGQVSNETGGVQAFIGTAAGSTPIPLPAGWSNATGYGINDSGQVAGEDSFRRGFIWDATNGARDLNTLVPAGWTIGSAGVINNINNKGQIAACGSNSSTGFSGFVVLTPTAMNGVDLSSLPSPTEWLNIADNINLSFVIADAWGGGTEKPGGYTAQQVLSNAPSGLQQAAYLLLNYDDPTQPGAKQVCYARESLGAICAGGCETWPYTCQSPQPEKLAFMAVDIEPICQGHFEGDRCVDQYGNDDRENLPQDFNSIAARIQRIYDAVQAVERAGLNPIIYANRSAWQEIAGGCVPQPGSPCTSTPALPFGCLPLWNPQIDEVDSLGTTWTAFGAWTQRVGKQYWQDDTAFGSAKVDLDVFGPSLFSGGTWGMALDETDANLGANVTVSGGGFRLNHGTNQYVQTVTITNTSASNTIIPGPVSLALDALSANARLVGANGATSCTVPAGGVFVNVPLSNSGTLAPGQSATATLAFTNSTNQGITYTPRVLVGSGAR